MLRVIHLLTAEIMHRCQVITEFLILKGRNGHLSQVYDEVAANDLVVFDIALKFRDLIEHGLHLGGFLSIVLKQSFECKFTSVDLIDGILAVLDLLQSIGTCSLNTLLS